MLTEEEFLKIKEEDLYVGIVHPTLDLVDEDIKLQYEEDLKKYLYEIKNFLVSSKEKLTNDEQVLLTYPVYDYIFDLQHYFDYPTILWKKNNDEYVDCINKEKVSNKLCDEKEMLPLSFYVSKNELNLCYLKMSIFEKTEFRICESVETYDDEVQTFLEHYYNKYIEREKNNLWLTDIDLKEYQALALSLPDLPHIPSAKIIDNDSLFLQILGKLEYNEQYDSLILNEIPVITQEFIDGTVINLETGEEIDLESNTLRAKEPLSLYYNSDQYQITSYYNKKLNREIKSVLLSDIEPVKLYMSNHLEMTEEEQKQYVLIYHEK